MDEQQIENMRGGDSLGIKPRRKTYYYINSHGNVVALSEEIAPEQHRLHPTFLGSSDDLEKTGFSINKAIAEHLQKNVQNPVGPQETRKITNYQKSDGVNMEQLKDQIRQELLEELKKTNEKLEPKTENQGGGKDTGKTS